MLIMMTMPVVTDLSRRSARRGGGGGGKGVFSTPFSYYCVVLVLHLVLLQFCVIFAAGDDVHLQRMTLVKILKEHEEEDQLDSRMQLPRHAAPSISGTQRRRPLLWNSSGGKLPKAVLLPRLFLLIPGALHLHHLHVHVHRHLHPRSIIRRNIITIQQLLHPYLHHHLHLQLLADHELDRDFVRIIKNPSVKSIHQQFFKFVVFFFSHARLHNIRETPEPSISPSARPYSN